MKQTAAFSVITSYQDPLEVIQSERAFGKWSASQHQLLLMLQGHPNTFSISL